MHNINLSQDGFQWEVLVNVHSGSTEERKFNYVSDGKFSRTGQAEYQATSTSLAREPFKSEFCYQSGRGDILVYRSWLSAVDILASLEQQQ